MACLLVIEDGDEYEEFARLFLAGSFDIVAAHTGDEALRCLEGGSVDALLIDLRFERAKDGDLLGDVVETASRLFAGDKVRATRWLKEQQGAVILGAIREAGHAQPAVFVHDFPPRRLANLRRLYGRVDAIASFDAAAIARALSEEGA